MLEAVGPGTGPPQRIEGPGGVDRAARAAPAAPVATTVKYEIPDAPPADLLDELDRAAAVIADLDSRQVAVRFDANRQAGGVGVQLVSGQGQLLREIPATRLLDVLASGSARGLAVDAVG